MKKLFLLTLSAALAATSAVAQTGPAEAPGQNDRAEQRRRGNNEDRRDRSEAERDEQSEEQAARRDRRRGREQAEDSRSSTRRRDNQQDRRSDNRDRADRRQQGENSQSDGEQSYQIQPAGWIAVAYDYDNDGFYEGADYIYYYDLETAKQRSSSRAQAEQEARNRQNNNSQQQASSRHDRESVRLRGEIVSLSTKNMMSSSRRDDAAHQFARIRTESGRTARVCLGKEEKLAELDLREGDQVLVEGVPARVDDQGVLLAERVSLGDETITNELPPQDNFRRLAGKVRSVSYTASGEREERHTVVKVKSPQGRIVQIDLGPTADVEDLNIQEEDEIAVLGRQGRIDGESLLIAQLIRAGGETVDVRESTNRSLRSARQREDQQRRRPLRDRLNR